MPEPEKNIKTVAFKRHQLPEILLLDALKYILSLPDDAYLDEIKQNKEEGTLILTIGSKNHV